LEQLIPILLFGGVASVVFLIAQVSSKQRRAAWTAAAASLGMTFTKGSFFDTDRIRGDLNGCGVEVYIFSRGSGKSRTTYTGIRVNGHLFAGLQLRKEGMGSALGKLFKGEDVQIGDPLFDRQVNIQGDVVEAIALLDAEARSGVLDLLSQGGTIEDGLIAWDNRGTMKNAGLIESRVRALVRLMNSLSLGSRDPIQCISENALKDPLPMVRLRNLDALLAARGMLPATMATARRCLDDPSAAVALRAALALGDEGLPHVEQLVNQRDVPPMMRIQALSVLGARGEEALIAMLDSGDVEVLRAAARALERCGTLAAVAPLLNHSKGMLTDSSLKQAARQAIDAIQARHGGGERGAFSIADGGDARGGLSIAEEDRRGAVSMANKKPDPAR